MTKQTIRNFYINEEQSFYLLSHHDAKKHKQWLNICKKQLEQLGYQGVEVIGHGAFGFVFVGSDLNNQRFVFKFSRITLSQKIRDRLEDEGYMLAQISHPSVPHFYAFERIKKQGILMMGYASGEDLEQLSLKQGRVSVPFLIHLALELRNILVELRYHQSDVSNQPIVHGDIKPSNIMWDHNSNQFSLVDFGSSVFAQEDSSGQPITTNMMDLMSHDVNYSNARMGDVYFIGEEQRQGAKSSPRFDEQGVASTLYALASAQSCRFGYSVVPAISLGLPVELANIIDGMLAKDKSTRDASGDYFIKNMPRIAKGYFPDLPLHTDKAMIPFWHLPFRDMPDTVVYSSRKQFLRQSDYNHNLDQIEDAQLDRYYKDFIFDMGDTQKAFLAAISRLAKYPVVGGLSYQWHDDKLSVESNLVLHDDQYHSAFTQALNNTILLAQGIKQKGLFKCCLFDAKQTIQLERGADGQVVIDELPELKYSVSELGDSEIVRPHSYFEDGKDPDEQLALPNEILKAVLGLNQIHHTGCIIIESLPERIKVHYYYRLLQTDKQALFEQLLNRIMKNIVSIQNFGVAGFMKLPYKNTREFSLYDHKPSFTYPKNPKEFS
jgi:non-specific serine/threonine protein kinase